MTGRSLVGPWVAPQTQIADSLGLDPKPVRKYLAPMAAGLVPGGTPVMAEADWWAQAWFPALVDKGLRE